MTPIELILAELIEQGAILDLQTLAILAQNGLLSDQSDLLSDQSDLLSDQSDLLSDQLSVLDQIEINTSDPDEDTISSILSATGELLTGGGDLATGLGAFSAGTADLVDAGTHAHETATTLHWGYGLFDGENADFVVVRPGLEQWAVVGTTEQTSWWDLGK